MSLHCGGAACRRVSSFTSGSIPTGTRSRHGPETCFSNIGCMFRVHYTSGIPHIAPSSGPCFTVIEFKQSIFLNTANILFKARQVIQAFLRSRLHFSCSTRLICLERTQKDPERFWDFVFLSVSDKQRVGTLLVEALRQTCCSLNGGGRAAHGRLHPGIISLRQMS